MVTRKNTGASKQDEDHDLKCKNVRKHLDMSDVSQNDDFYELDPNIDYQEKFWLYPDDPWFGRPFIGDEDWKDHMRHPIERLKPRVATFYDSENETEEFDISDEEEDIPSDTAPTKTGISIQLFKGSNIKFEPVVMSDAAYEAMCKRMMKHKHEYDE